MAATRVLVLLLSVAGSADVAAQSAPEQVAQLPALKQMTLEELLDVDVTLPSRRSERVGDAAAAVHVVTNEDIRRSGAVSLPEVLRSTPYLFVGRFTASSWVVSARGFASTAANKLLVMIDGRSIYSPLFSGVFWEQQDAVLNDLEQIEIIRGPGAALWGSNAVNGVINVVSKPAAETQGSYITIGGGAEEHFLGGVRYGGTAGAGHYRVHGKFFARDQAVLTTDEAAHDGQRMGLGGFRFDLRYGSSDLTVQGDLNASRVDLADREDLEASGGNVLGRWSKRFSPNHDLQLRGYYDRTNRLVPLQFQESRDTFDLDYQHRLRLGARYALGWGAGYRLSRDDTTPTILVRFDPEDRTTDLLSAFVQSEINVSSSVGTTFGARIETNDYTGVEFQPTVRLRWKPDERQTLWGSVSRAVRLPTRVDTDIRVFTAGRLVITGNPGFASEELSAYEVGYRVAPASIVSADAVVFHHRYDDLRTQEFPTAAGQPITLGNGLNATSSGAELTLRVQPRTWARVTASYAYLTKELTLDPQSRDLTRGETEAIDPAHQLLVQGRFNLPQRVELDGTVRYVSELPSPGTPAYTEGTLRIAWRVRPNVEVSLVGRDLFHEDHLEFVSPTSPRRTRLERAIYTRLAIAF